MRLNLPLSAELPPQTSLFFPTVVFPLHFPTFPFPYDPPLQNSRSPPMHRISYSLCKISSFSPPIFRSISDFSRRFSSAALVHPSLPSPQAPPSLLLPLLRRQVPLITVLCFPPFFFPRQRHPMNWKVFLSSSRLTEVQTHFFYD